jgi:hypothetical protein
LERGLYLRAAFCIAAADSDISDLKSQRPSNVGMSGFMEGGTASVISLQSDAD